MAKYLWRGRPHSETASLVSKYCWNTPGNWKVQATVGGILQWVSTGAVPGPGDDVVIGGESELSYQRGETYTDYGNLRDINDAIPLTSSGDPGSYTQRRVTFKSPFVSENDVDTFEPFPIKNTFVGELSGWQPASCPLLFGGYSGGVGSGTWYAGATAQTGNTWTSPLNSLRISTNGLAGVSGTVLGNFTHTFAFMVGSGLTGLALKLAVEHDKLYLPSVTEASYSTPVYGFDPSQPLKVKVKEHITVRDGTWHELPGFMGSSGELSAVDPVAGVTNNWLTSLRQLRIDEKFDVTLNTVKAYTTWAGFTGNGVVNTEFRWHSPGSGQLNLNGGSFKRLLINAEFNRVRQYNHAYKGTWWEGLNPLGVEDAYISSYAAQWWTAKNTITDVIAEYADIGNVVSTTLEGGTYGSVTLYQCPNAGNAGWLYNRYRLTLDPNPEGPRRYDVYANTYIPGYFPECIVYSQPKMFVKCNFDKTAALADLYTNPSGFSGNNGALILSDRPFYVDWVQTYFDQGGSPIDLRPFQDVSDYDCLGWRAQTAENGQFDVAVPETENVRPRIHHLDTFRQLDISDSIANQAVTIERGSQVYLYKNNGVTITIPEIHAHSAINTGDVVKYRQMPWSVVANGNLICNKMVLNASNLYSGQNLNGSTGTVRVGECHLRNYARVDFGQFVQEFDDWRFGGLTGNLIAGGIVFDDTISQISGSEGLKLVNTVVKANTDIRTSASYGSAGKVTPFYPTSSSP